MIPRYALPLALLISAPLGAQSRAYADMARSAVRAHESANYSAAISAARTRITADIPAAALTGVVQEYCAGCHNTKELRGGLSLENFDVAAAPANAEVAEKMIGKLRTGMMPPPKRRRPGGDSLVALVETLERLIDKSAATKPEPGSRTFQRLNRVEYERSIHELLGLDVNAGDWLPLDTKSANFDNIADVQVPSATVLDAYLDAASEIARLAVGDAKARNASKTYKIARLHAQWDRAEGAPIGTRGGISVIHNFPADGEYTFSFELHSIPTGQLFGSDAPFDEQAEISVDGVRVALIKIDRWQSQADPANMEVKTEPVVVRAGPHRVTAAFLQTFDGPNNDLIARHGHSIGDTQIGSELGITNVAHMRDMTVTGPTNPTGVSETPSRRRIFSCRPTTAEETRPCAERIINSIGGAAYRRALAPSDVTGLMKFYDAGAKDGGFEMGIRVALEAMLSSPHFIFRTERVPVGAKPGDRYALNDADLASRLSFFLWGAPPDDVLLDAAKRGGLSQPKNLETQARRMLADPRAEALASRFASQWLRLQDIDKVHPDALQFPDFREQLGESMRRETEVFFEHLVRENKSIFDLYSANYTFVNEALAKHYGFTGVTGPEFQRVQYPDNRRIGLFGHASMLTLTSHANRTSPVLRGKWVMEVILGAPPPPPPPDVPDLDKTTTAKEGRTLTTRERMEMHRSDPTCNACHQYIDPIGLALDNFDVTGRWRIREFDNPLDTRGELYDGTPVTSPTELQQALMKRPIPMIRAFTQNLMAYALGRRVEYYDMPAVRTIVAGAEPSGYKMQEFILGVIRSDAFRMGRVPNRTSAGN
ncbi:MAG TPA: DUF1592 domain-containing protein [Gemmatimonadaceae bacterium]|nr:DUF1592 domain-containing protein [Gemmatimonadaceae bacterium]